MRRYFFLIFGILFLLFLAGYIYLTNSQQTTMTMQLNMSSVPAAQRSSVLVQEINRMKQSLQIYGIPQASLTANREGAAAFVTITLPAGQPTAQIQKLFTQQQTVSFWSGGTAGSSTSQLIQSDIGAGDIQNVKILQTNGNQTQVSITFTQQGLTKFEQLVHQNFQKPIYTYVNGNLISSAHVAIQPTAAVTNPTVIMVSNNLLPTVRLLAAQTQTGPLPVIPTNITTTTTQTESLQNVAVIGMLVSLLLFLILGVATFWRHYVII